MATRRTKKQPNPDHARERALDLIAFIDRSPTPYHAVAEAIRRLERAKFTPLDEGDAWKLRAGDRRYVVRNGSSIIAFIAGTESPAEGGFKMIGAHTDSPNLKLKPRPALSNKGFKQLGVEVYGGVLIHTWFDRDLSLAGRIAVRGPKKVEMRLVDLQKPMLRIPNLAIHMNRDVNKDGFKANFQTHLPPVIALDSKDKDKTELWKTLVAENAGVSPDAILDHDLSLYDVQKGIFGGANEEFVHIARLDNLGSSHAALTSLIDTAGSALDATRLIALYDHEEIGSRSIQGAAGPFLENVLTRIVEALGERGSQAFARSMARSFHISADMAHSVHPNYADKHEPQHMPILGGGPVIKSNAQQSYASDGESAAVFAKLCLDAGFEAQNYVVRTDLGCGSTIGPITAARIGVKTVDVGNPMLSMHSIRETAGSADVEKMIRVMSLFLQGG